MTPERIAELRAAAPSDTDHSVARGEWREMLDEIERLQAENVVAWTKVKDALMLFLHTCDHVDRRRMEADGGMPLARLDEIGRGLMAEAMAHTRPPLGPKP